MSELLKRIEHLNAIGIALSAEADTQKLLEIIMMGAKSLTHADGGTLYLLEDEHLSFQFISNDSLNIRMDGSLGHEITFPSIPLRVDGVDNHSNVVTHSVLSGKTINIVDAYHEKGFDFTGTRQFDAHTGYRTQSMLTFPLKDHERKIIGVLQLINAHDAVTEEVTAFSAVDQQLAESLASQAAVTLTQQRLIADLKTLFESFIKMIASAVDDKSPYTGGHCRRIPVLTMLLAEAVDKTDTGPLSDFSIDDSDRYELETAAWLHDCGKVVTPEHVMDKATKLETIYDRIGLLETRIEVLLRDAEIAYLRALQDPNNSSQNQREVLEQRYHNRCKQLGDAKIFLQEANIGSESLSNEDRARIIALSKFEWVMEGQTCPLITADELKNLTVYRGTLNDEEREIINNHIVITIKMLESLPFPEHLRNVPEYVGGHHEKMDGSGYPKGLKREEMSVQARIMAVADIFEALTASDRPYKKGKKLSECLDIMRGMKASGHIDSDIFDIFVQHKVYLDYAREFLDSEQIDEVEGQ